MVDFFPQQTQTLAQLVDASGLFVQVTGLPGVGTSTWLRQRAQQGGVYLDVHHLSSVYEVDTKLAVQVGGTMSLEQWLSVHQPALICVDHVSSELYLALCRWFANLPNPPACVLLGTTHHVSSTDPTLKLTRPESDRVRGWASLHLAHISEPVREVILQHVQYHPSFILAWATYAHFVPESQLLEQMPTTIEGLLRPAWQELPQPLMATLARFVHPISGQMLASLMQSFDVALHHIEAFLAMGWLVRQPDEAHHVPHYVMHGVCRQFVQAQPVEPHKVRYVECIERWCADQLPMSAQVLQQRFDDVYRAWQDIKQTGQHAPALQEVISWLMSAVSMSTSLVQLPKMEESLNVQIRRDLNFGDHLGATRKLLWAEHQHASLSIEERAQLWSVLGKLHRRQGRYHEAADAYEHSVAIIMAHDGFNARLHKYLWRAIECHQHTQRARRALDLLEQLDALPDHAIGQKRIDYERMRHTLVHDDERAQRLGLMLLNELSFSAVERAQVACWLGDVSLRAGQLNQARTHYLFALDVDESRALRAQLEGRLLDLALMEGSVLPEFSNELAMHSPTGRLRVALVRLQEGELESAHQIFQQSLAQDLWSNTTRVLLRHLVMMLRGEAADRILDSLETITTDESWTRLERALLQVLIAKCNQDTVTHEPIYQTDGAIPCAMVWVLRRWQPALMAVSVDLDLLCQRDGRWFQCGEAPRVDLSRKHTARRLLASLIEQHLSAPQTAMTFDALFAQGWPGQLAIKQSAARNRLRVSINRLRTMGLDSLIITTDDGYMFDPMLTIEVVNRADP